MPSQNVYPLITGEHAKSANATTKHGKLCHDRTRELTMQTTKLQREEGNFAQHIYLHFISHLYIYYSFLFAKAYNNSCNANLVALFD